MQVKQRNQDTVKMKEQKQKEREQEERMLMERNLSMKANIKDSIQTGKDIQQRKVIDEAERIKNEKREQKEMMNM
jgi:hypothetical protein